MHGLGFNAKKIPSTVIFEKLLSLGREREKKSLIFVSSTLVIYGSEIKRLSTTRDIVCTDAGNFVLEVNSELD